MIVSTPGGEHRLDLVEAVDLDLEVRGVRELRSRPCSARRSPRDPLRGEHREVVVLGHHRVRERVAVVVPAAATHRVPFERAQARRGLAGVDDARAGVGGLRDVARPSAWRCPLIRCTKFSATRSACSTERAGPDDRREHVPGLERVAVGDRERCTVDGGVGQASSPRRRHRRR